MPRRDKSLFSRPIFFELAWQRSIWLADQSIKRVRRKLATFPWVAERLRFYQAWRNNPQGIGAIAPSSVRLARAMTRYISVQSGQVLELGAGTGVFTRALLARGVEEADLTLIEMDSTFAARLAHDHPLATVHAMDASKLASHTMFGTKEIGAAVCGVPLLNLPLKTRIGIVRGSFVHLRQGGAFYFFTYGLHCPIPKRVLDHLRLRASKIDLVLANVPPAHVWRITRRGPRTPSHYGIIEPQQH